VTEARTGLLLPGIVALAGLAVLIGLGTWQLERKAWKENLIATVEQRLAAAPAALPPRAQWDTLNQQQDEFRRVSLRATIPPDTEGRVYASGSGLRDDIKGPGYFAFAPARLADGSVVVINRGYVPNPSAYASLRPLGVTGEPIDVIGVLRWPEPRGAFVSDHTARDDLWFTRDHRAMAAHYGWGQAAPFYIEQEAPVPPGGLPRPGTLKINLRNEHLNYALTWYGLAAVLVAVFAVWAFGRRRREERAGLG
jgi:surfeit locus 1 family protein